jgi:hypothetical protein
MKNAKCQMKNDPVAMVPAQGLIAVFLFRGFGSSAAKSSALLRVSVQPLFILAIDLELLGAAVGPVPRKQFAVVP